MSKPKTSDHELIAAVERYGSIRGAARALGVDHSGIVGRLQRMKARGYNPDYDMTKPVPQGFALSGVSTMYDADGKIKAQWVKSRNVSEDSELLQEVADALKETLPKYKPCKPVAHDATDLMSVFVVTDYHFGMKSWHEETGADWDIKIAEDLLVRWFDKAIALSPRADKAVLCQLGDFLHWDGMDSVTPESKHLLDADSRFQKLVRVVIRVLRRIIAQLLEKYPAVHIIMAEGNHDPASSIWLREWLASVYEDEPRITVDVSPDPYYCIEHGLTSLFFHHGHKRKPGNVDAVFTAKFREVFGRTKHSYAHMGHMHHVDQRETNLMIVEQHRTLAAPDAYASRGGWMSGRDAQVITYHAEHGEVSRLRINSRMV